jgi:hypothetical protein
VSTGSSNAVTGACTNIDLSMLGTLNAANFLGFAGKQTRTEADGGWPRRCALSSPAAATARMQVRIAEDDAGDVESTHVSETVGAVILGNNMLTTPVDLAWTAAFDSIGKAVAKSAT